MDRKLKFKLLQPVKEKKGTDKETNKKVDKTTLAGVEGLKLKKLIGALRALWRSSKMQGFDDRVTEMKSYLRASPSPSRPDPMPLQDETSSDDDAGTDGEEASPASSKDEVAAELDGEPDQEEFAAALDGNPLSEPDQDAGESEEAAGTMSDSDVDSVNAPTLTLGESPAKSEKSEDLRDSQVSSGWLGQAYNLYNGIEKAEKKFAAERAKQAELDTTATEILADLERELGVELLHTTVGQGYHEWCFNALCQYGFHVYGMLATVDNFKSWLSRGKDGLRLVVVTVGLVEIGRGYGGSLHSVY